MIKFMERTFNLFPQDGKLYRIYYNSPYAKTLYGYPDLDINKNKIAIEIISGDPVLMLDLGFGIMSKILYRNRVLYIFKGVAIYEDIEE